MSRLYVSIEPRMLRWAIERSGGDFASLGERFPLSEWEDGRKKPTLKQLEDFANATRTPIGYLFLPRPPEVKIPIPDFRTPGNAFIQQPSPDLLETIFLCQEQQDWYREHARQLGEVPLPFIGSVTTSDDVAVVAREIREKLNLSIEERRRLGSWEEARRQLLDKADHLGILVMVSGVVGNNTSRPLNTDEFRGFALSDERAPLIFVNGADTKSAQMFTVAHEIAHLWLGKTALDDAQPATLEGQALEQWCNRVAAEVLVPLDVIKREHSHNGALRAELDRLANYFKVSTLVILRRLHEAGRITEPEMWAAYVPEAKRLKALEPVASGGDYYTNVKSRMSRRFMHALYTSTLEGQTLQRDALRLLDLGSAETFENLGERLGVS